MLIDRGLGKEDGVLIYSEMLLHYKKIIVIPFAATWMGLEIVRLSETEKNKYHMVSIIVDLKKNGTNKLIYKTEIES